MSQLKRNSLIESLTNTLSGFVVSYVAGLIVFPLFGFEATAVQVGWITLIYTALSVMRNYVVRRIFNGRISDVVTSPDSRSRASEN